MLEGHEIEVCQLSGGPDFPVRGHDIKIGGFQVSLDILKIKSFKIKGFGFMMSIVHLPRTASPAMLMLLSRRHKGMTGRGVPGPSPSW